jgi:arabinan endo-1,5-alpha-L-arabinosidase
VLGIQPLLWKKGWPMAGGSIRPGTYEVQSERSGGALQLAIDETRLPFDFRRSVFAQPGAPVGPSAVDLGVYMIRPHQTWTVDPVGAGNYTGAPFNKITIAGTMRARSVAGDAILPVPVFPGAREQLWQIDQLTDGSYRILSVAASGSKKPTALVATGASTAALATFDPADLTDRWTVKQP